MKNIKEERGRPFWRGKRANEFLLKIIG